MSSTRQGENHPRFPNTDITPQFERISRPGELLPHFIPNCADMLQHLTDVVRDKKRSNQLSITLGERELSAFEQMKVKLAEAALLVQLVDGEWQPLSFFSKRLELAESHNRTFDRELLAMCLIVKHFRHLLEGRTLIIYTDRKRLVYA